MRRSKPVLPEFSAHSWTHSGQSLIERLLPLVMALGVLALWLLSRPYVGIEQDARLYVGSVMAALDPDGLGRDMVFAEDGQFGFTAFPQLLSAAFAAFGISNGAMLVTLAGLILWIGAMAFLICQVAEGKSRWVLMVFVIVLPATYGSYGLFSFGQPFATPRLFAEALVLLAIGLLAAGRKGWALAPLIAATVFHPIMALPGFGIWVWLVLFDPRMRVCSLAVSLACVGGLALLLVGAAALDMPIVGRLLSRIEPAYWEILYERTPYLFPSAWRGQDWSVLLVGAATIVAASRYLKERLRSVFIAIVVVGLGGVVLSLLLDSLFGSLLAAQVQLWRSAWLIAVFGALSLGFCSVVLWRKGGGDRLALAFLYLAWTGTGSGVFSLLPAAVALALLFLPQLQNLQVRAGVSVAIWGLVVFCGSIFFATRVYAFYEYFEASPDGSFGMLHVATAMNLWTLPLCFLVVVWANTANPRWLPAALTVVVALLAGTTFAVWDDRAPRRVAADRFAPNPELAALLSSRQGEVLWMDGEFETWSLAGRPNWFTTFQGAGIVFSRPLAFQWDARAQRLIDLGVADKRSRAPFKSEEGGHIGPPPRLRNLSDDTLRVFCAAGDAPAWIITPVETLRTGSVSPKRWPLKYWRAPHPLSDLKLDGNAIAWTTTEDYAVIPCGS